MRQHKYILQGHTPVAEPDLMKWAWFIEDGPHSVGIDEFDAGETHVKVSTIFTGLDRNALDDDRRAGISTAFDRPPILFETIVWAGQPVVRSRTIVYQERYETWDEAAQGHAQMVRLCRDPDNLWRLSKVTTPRPLKWHGF